MTYTLAQLKELPVIPAKWNQIVETINGTTLDGVRCYPTKYIVRNNTGVYEAIDSAHNLVYGGSSDAGGVDGDSPSAVINAAVNALTGSRTWKEKVTLMDNIVADDSITLPDYTILEILGTLKAKDALNTSLIQNTYAATGTAYVDPVSRNSNIEICGPGIIDGNKDNQATATDDKDTINFLGVNYFKIHGLTMINGWTENIRTGFSSYGLIANNHIYNSADDGIAINKETHYTTVSGNVIIDAGSGTYYGAPCGIEVQDGSTHIAVTGNVVKGSLADGIQVSTHGSSEDACDAVSITGNEVSGCTGAGINTAGLTTDYINGLTITGNTVSGNTSIGISSSYARNVNISGNTVTGNDGLAGIQLYYEVQKFLISNNIVADNLARGIFINDPVNNGSILCNEIVDNGAAGAGSEIGLALEGDYINIKGNNIYDSRSGAARTQKLGIYVYSGGDNNVITENWVHNNVTTDFTDAGASNTVRFNTGYTTENNVLSGTFEIDSTGLKTVTIAHGCSYTPSKQHIQACIVEDTDVDDWWGYIAKIGDITASNVVVFVYVADASATGGATAKISLRVQK